MTDEASMEYSVIITNMGFSERIFWQASRSCGSIFSSFQSSFFGPLPKAGGSSTIASYFAPLLASLWANFRASSIIHLTGFSESPLISWFLRAHSTDGFEASTWVASHPLFAATKVAAPAKQVQKPWIFPLRCRFCDKVPMRRLLGEHPQVLGAVHKFCCEFYAFKIHYGRLYLLKKLPFRVLFVVVQVASVGIFPDFRAGLAPPRF